MIPTRYKWLAVVLAIVGAYVAGNAHGHKAERTECDLEITTIERNAETARADAAEAARLEERTKQKAVNHAIQKQADDLAAVNHRLAADVERLRDRAERPVGLSEAARAECAGANGPELAREYAQFLAGYAALAAEQDAALAACYSYADSVATANQED